MQDLLGVHPRAVIEQITLVRCGNGPSVELFQYTSPDQERTFRKNSDFGGKHIAFYVRHIDRAVAYMQAKGVEKLLGPLAVTDGPAAGQSINYFRAPFGTYIELISYPKGMAYEETADDAALGPAGQPAVAASAERWLQGRVLRDRDSSASAGQSTDGR